MKWRWRHLVPVAIAAVALAFWGLQALWPWLLRHHALRAESPYFLRACVVCAVMPFVLAALHVSFRALGLRMCKRRQRGKTEAFASDRTDIEQ